MSSMVWTLREGGNRLYGASGKRATKRQSKRKKKCWKSMADVAVRVHRANPFKIYLLSVVV